MSFSTARKNLLYYKLVGVHNPAQAWRICFLAAVSLDSLSPPLAVKVWAVAVWNAIWFVWLALVWANWVSVCALRRVDMIAARSRPPGTAAGADTGATGAGTGASVRWVPVSVGGVLGLQYPQLSPQASVPSSSRAGPPNRSSNLVGAHGSVLGGGGFGCSGPVAFPGRGGR